MEERYIVTREQLDRMRQTEGDLVRVAFKGGDINKADDRADEAYHACLAIEVPQDAKGFYVIDENGDPKCVGFQ
jgi:hypothetical protein